MHHVAVIIAAGGRGVRFGGARPKQWLELGGQTILARSVAAFDRHQQVQELVIVLPPGTLASSEFVKPEASKPVRFVEGGARRQDSVANGFAAISADADIVLVHDAARPLVSTDIISRTIAAAAQSGAAIAAIPVHDTVKETTRQAERTVISRTLARETLYLAQTPQGFRRDVLAAAIALGEAGGDATDEATLAERAGYAVEIVAGDPDNLKITTEGDLKRAQVLMQDSMHPRSPSDASKDQGQTADREPSTMTSRPGAVRVGIGYDLHRLVEGRPLILGGVIIPYERGLLGHSDADAVCHAVTDAILGAANLGDIGRLFPDNDPAWKDANSLMLLADAFNRVRAAGWLVSNLDIVVIAQRPKIGPHADAIRASLARVLEVVPDAVSIKGKTNEGVDAIGQGDAIAVHAVTLLSRA
jgi:2-C-methyl-D-erythritol 4-phosphate cytidylyltransferase/2-C-methyl-D-erythritol 2,4-cyclodiphosphate synthase